MSELDTQFSKKPPIKSPTEILDMGDTARREYFNRIKTYSNGVPFTTHAGLLYKTLPTVMVNFQNYELDIDYEGLRRAISICEQTPFKSGIFTVNHSNSHDGPNMHSVLSHEGLIVSLLVASDPLSPILKKVFENVNSTTIDRKSADSKYDGTMEMLHRLICGQYIVIYPESTWNLHPTRPMQGVKRGAIFLGAASNQPVIPTIMEYIEIPELFTKESKMYRKVVIRFGEPIFVKQNVNIDLQASELEKTMAEMRKQIWDNEGINRNSLNEMNPLVNANHTALKTGAFSAASIEEERKGILFHSNVLPYNAYSMQMANKVDEMWIPGTPGPEFTEAEYLDDMTRQLSDKELNHIIVPLNRR